MNDEYDPNAIIEEAMGPDEDDDEGISAYALNRQKLNQSRVVDPDRFQKQMDTLQQFVNPEDPTFLSEFLMDMKTGLDTAKKAPGGPVVKGLAAAGAIGVRRMSSKYIKNMLDSIIPEGPITVYAMGKKRPGKFSTQTAFNRARYYNSPDYTNKIARELVNTWGMKDLVFYFDQYEIMRPKVLPS